MATIIDGAHNFDSARHSPLGFNSGAVGTYAYLTFTGNSGYVGGSGLVHGTAYSGSNFEYGVVRNGADIDCNAYYYVTGTPGGSWVSIGSAGHNSHFSKTLCYRVA